MLFPFAMPRNSRPHLLSFQGASAAKPQQKPEFCPVAVGGTATAYGLNVPARASRSGMLAGGRSEITATEQT